MSFFIFLFPEQYVQIRLTELEISIYSQITSKKWVEKVEIKNPQQFNEKTGEPCVTTS